MHGRQRQEQSADQGAERAVFSFAVPVDHPALPGHFPGRPIVPGVLLIDSVVAGLSGDIAARVCGIIDTKFAQPVAPGALCQVEIESRPESVAYRIRTVDGVTIAHGRLRLAPTE